MLLRGESGIGKSALLDFARSRADGFRILSATGVETELEIPFGALADLLRPVLGSLDAIPPPQAATLRAAFALGPPSAPDRFAAAAGALSLLAAAAGDGPVLVLVDDLHWVDRASREALLFAARRLESEGVAVLMAARTEPGTKLEAAGLPELILGGIDRAAARELILRSCAPGLAVGASVADDLFDATSGNPLALIEAVILLSDAQLTGDEALPTPLPAGDAIVRGFLSRIEAVSEETRWVMTVAAAAASDDVDLLVRAVGGDAPVALAESTGEVEVREGSIAFRHPLMRSALYRTASPDERRSAHRALAGATDADDIIRRAWHLAAAALGPDEAVAAALEAAGRRSGAGGGHAEANRAFEHAARMSPDGEGRVRRELLAAGSAQFAGDFDKAWQLLDSLLGTTRDPLLRAEVTHRLGVVEIWRGNVTRGRGLLLAGATDTRETHPGVSLKMLMDAVIPSFMQIDVRGALHTADSALELAQGLKEAEDVARGLLGFALYLSGDETEAERVFDLAAEGLLSAGGILTEYPQCQQFVWLLLIGLERFDDARRSLDAGVEGARLMGAPSFLPATLAFRSELNYREGNWPGALADASESVELAEDTKQRGQLAHSLMMLARIEAVLGREEACRAHCAHALEIASGFGLDGILPYGDHILGLLELGMGRPRDAIPHLESLEERVEKRGLGKLAVVYWAPLLIEAYVLVGDTDRAAESLAWFEKEARVTGAAWARAAAARCRGMIAPEDEMRDAFTEALSVGGAASSPFERARTRLCFGERLRRTRNRAEARDQLRAALVTFEDLHAIPWAERARSELRASGERLRRDPSEREELTNRELQVAVMVGSGATNDEAAGALFVSPKTIEAHLGRIYRKLGLRSRTELAAYLSKEPSAET